MIDPRIVQHFLNSAGDYRLAEDGQFGPRSLDAARDYLADRRYPSTWPDARTYIAIEQLLLNSVGFTLLVDGMAGPKTNAALAAFKPGAMGTVTAPPKAPSVPASNWPRQRDVPGFFGANPRTALMGYVTPPYQMYGDYRRKPEHRVSRFMCHKFVKEPITRILNATLDWYGTDNIRRLNLDIFSGCRVIRRITGGVGWSMHSWGIAVDIDAANNEFRDTWASGKMDGAEYKAFVDFWYAEGAINLGRERNYDPMHYQFARL